MNILYVVRQRQRALLGVFIAIAAAYLLYALFFTREYTAYAQVSDYNSRSNVNALRIGPNSPYLAPLRSDALIKKIAADLSDADRRRLAAPFDHWLHWGPGIGPVEILLEGRRLTAADGMVDVGFQHPDPAVAALIANALASEFVRESNASKDERMHQSLADLDAKIKTQRDKTDNLRAQMKDLSNQFGGMNFDSGADSVYLETIADLNKQVVQYKGAMDTLDLHRQQVLDQMGAQKAVWDLEFIRSQSNIAQLYATAQNETNHVQELRSENYQEEAPAMTDAKARLDVAMKELNAATDAAVHELVANLQAAQSNFNQAAKRLDDMQRKNQELSGARSVYDSLRKDLNTSNDVLSKMEVAVSDAETNFNLTDPNYAVLAPAESPSTADARPWANIGLTGFGLGVGGSLLALVAFALFRPPPKLEREEFERRRRRHRHFRSSRHRSGSESSQSSSSRRHD